mgnify:FL=1|tara:strand:+ start:501 stop:869 length:369 start_codon:yes stop_codon:yes gene_type:complete
MSKFLKLIDENRPGINSEYVISIQGPAEFENINVSGDEFTYDLHEKIKAVVEGRADIIVHEEDQEGILSDKERDALKVASELVKEPKKSAFGRDPKKALQKSLGKMYKGISKRVNDVAKDLS